MKQPTHGIDCGLNTLDIVFAGEETSYKVRPVVQWCRVCGSIRVATQWDSSIVSTKPMRIPTYKVGHSA